MNKGVLVCRRSDWSSCVSLTYQLWGCEFKQHVVSAYNSKLNWLGFAIFLPMVDGSLEALKHPPPIEIDRNKITNSAKNTNQSINLLEYQNLIFVHIQSIFK